MFHVEPMIYNKKNKILKAKDHLVSKELFDIYWDPERLVASTDVKHISDLKAYYDSSAYISHQSEPKNVINILYTWAREFMLRNKFKLIKKYLPKHKRILDIGCGTGSFLDFMKKKGYEVLGVENNKIAKAACLKKDLKVLVSESDLDAQKFDLISLWHVLEHLERPDQNLSKYSEILHDDGTLVVAVPNFESHDRLYYQGDWAALDVPRHLWHFTPQGLKKLAQENGFECVEQHPLVLDIFYICFLSEKHRKKLFPLLRGVLKGIYFTLRSLFTKQHSSCVFIFKKQAP